MGVLFACEFVYAWWNTYMLRASTEMKFSFLGNIYFQEKIRLNQDSKTNLGSAYLLPNEAISRMKYPAQYISKLEISNYLLKLLSAHSRAAHPRAFGSSRCMWIKYLSVPWLFTSDYHNRFLFWLWILISACTCHKFNHSSLGISHSQEIWRPDAKRLGQPRDLVYKPWLMKAHASDPKYMTPRSVRVWQSICIHLEPDEQFKANLSSQIHYELIKKWNHLYKIFPIRELGKFNYLKSHKIQNLWLVQPSGK